MTRTLLRRVSKRLNRRNCVTGGFLLLLVVVTSLMVPPLNAAPLPQVPGLYDPVARSTRCSDSWPCALYRFDFSAGAHGVVRGRQI